MACVQMLRSLSKHPSPEDFMSIFNANVISRPTSSIQIFQLDKSIGKPSVTGSLYNVLPRSVTIAPGTKLGAAKKALIQLVRDQQKRSFSQSIATSHISIHGTAIEEAGVACALSTENSIFDTSGVNNKHFCSLEQSGDSSNNVHGTTATNMRIGFSTLGGRANPIFILPPMHVSVLLPASQLEMGLKSSLSTALTTRESHIAYPTEFSNLRRNNCINRFRPTDNTF